MNNLISFRYLAEYCLFRIIIMALQLLPKSISLKIISNTFLFLGKFSKYNSIAKKNCKIVFPNLNDKEIKLIIKNSWIKLSGVAEIVTITSGLDGNYGLVKFEGASTLTVVKLNNFKGTETFGKIFKSSSQNPSIIITPIEVK